MATSSRKIVVRSQLGLFFSSLQTLFHEGNNWEAWSIEMQTYIPCLKTMSRASTTLTALQPSWSMQTFSHLQTLRHPALFAVSILMRSTQGDPILWGDCEVSIGFLLQHESLTQVPPLPKFVGPLDLYIPNWFPLLLSPNVALFLIVGDCHRDQLLIGKDLKMDTQMQYLPPGSLLSTPLPISPVHQLLSDNFHPCRH